jgi:hypothetical protein
VANLSSRIAAISHVLDLNSVASACVRVCICVCARVCACVKFSTKTS